MPFADYEYVKLAPNATPMAVGQIDELAGASPEWNVEDGEIEREYDLGGFPAAVDFVTRVATLAEQTDHHPDIHICYRRVHLVLSPHSIGGLSENDFILAGRIDCLLD